jgi:hypothetical protein
MPVVEGVVFLHLVDAGSKSEHERPMVIDDVGAPHRVHVIGDNPFEEGSLRGLVGQRVRAEGTMRGETLRVSPDALVVLPPPTETADGE